MHWSCLHPVGLAWPSSGNPVSMNLFPPQPFFWLFQTVGEGKSIRKRARRFSPSWYHLCHYFSHDWHWLAIMLSIQASIRCWLFHEKCLQFVGGINPQDPVGFNIPDIGNADFQLEVSENKNATFPIQAHALLNSIPIHKTTVSAWAVVQEWGKETQ